MSLTAADDQSRPVEARQSSDFLRILKYLIPAWRSSLLIVAIIVVGTILNLLPPLLLREVIDVALPRRDTAALNWLVGGMILARLAAGLMGVWQARLVTEVSHGVMFDLRCAIYEKLLRQSMRFFTTTKSGEIHSRLQNDVGGVERVITDTLVLLATNILVVIGTMIVLLRMDWLLTLVACVMLPAFILPTRNVGRIRSKISQETHERLADLTSYVQETLSVSGYLLVRLFGSQPHEQRRYGEKMGAVRDLQIRQTMTGRWLFMWMVVFVGIGPAIIYLVGGHEIIAGRLTLGTVMAFVTLVMGLYTPVSVFVNVHVEIAAASSLFRRIFEYLDLEVEIVDPPQPAPLSRPLGKLSFENVSMSYGANSASVRDISFEIEPGQMVALVGPSGAGKTTLTYLATRLYDPTAGRVLFDDTDLRQISLGDLSHRIAMVTQETTLFNATVGENLRYAKPDASQEELERACKSAQIHQVITALPQGYETIVGERGFRLSGGEKQRLAIARVILRDPSLLILDEATSSLDSHSESLVRGTLEPLLTERTSLVIAHRLSTILQADMILVLDNGRIVERGRHTDLLAQGGLYSRLYREQFRSIETAS